VTDVRPVLDPLAGITADLAALYKDLHQHPELSHQEERTAATAAARIGSLGYEVTTGVGGTGVVGVLRNGDGPTVLLRADMDALPVEEQTGLPYASTVTATDADGKTVPVMHACGHDMHVTCLVGAADLLARARDGWQGTLLTVFQPAEEVGGGARGMVEDHLFDRVGRPDIVLGQHVAPLPAGTVGYRAGPAFAASDALRVTFFGRGGHGSRPEVTIDPVVMAAATVMRLQTVVSREIAGSDVAVVTVGAINAGTKDNVIPDTAEIKLNIRSYTPDVRHRVLAAVERIIKGEAAASGAEKDPEIAVIATFPVLDNDAGATAKTTAAIGDAIGKGRLYQVPAATGSEDVGDLATAAKAPICYWLFGGIDPVRYAKARQAGRLNQDIPSNHQATFAPVVEPTLTTGVEALTAAALAWLG
jgi:hippurate hydrolase